MAEDRATSPAVARRMAPRAAAVVLAAGAGRRFGATKQLARLEGRPLVQHVVDALLAVPDVAPIVVVLGHRAEDVCAALRPERAEVVVCDRWEAGMGASLSTGLGALAAADPAWTLVLLGDQPRVSAVTVERVLAAARHAPAGIAAVRAAHGAVPGHPVALGRELRLEAARFAGGGASPRRLLAGAAVQLVQAGPECVTDVDTPADLAALVG